MAISFRNFIQIAGIIDRVEAHMLIDQGVTYLGFPLRLAVHKEDLSEQDAAKIIQNFPPSVHGVLITYMDGPEDIHALCKYLGITIVQLHGDISSDALSRLKTLAPQLQIIKSLIVGQKSPAQLGQMVWALSPIVDAFITDTYDPDTGATGATGKPHDWAVSHALVELSPRPIILAGGLTPENVPQAIRMVGPDGVDTHTGVEGPDGRKDPDRVQAFLSETRKAFGTR